MRILYFTKALPSSLYNALLNEGHLVNNPSNQNFHLRMIDALSMRNEVEIVSALPSAFESRHIERKKNWHFIADHGFLKNAATIAKEFDGQKIDVLLFDSLAIKLGFEAIRFSKKKGVFACAIITDNPINLTSSPLYFRLAFRKLLSKADGGIALSPGLQGLKPGSLLLPGVVRPSTCPPHREATPYLYFAGSLLPQYGLPKLIDAYIKANLSWPFFIAGHSSSLKPRDGRVRFLGQLSEQENASFEAGAGLLLNPRPLNAKRDMESIPSKLFEYLASGSPIVSTAHPFFAKHFPDDIDFIDENGFFDYFRAHRQKDGSLAFLKKNAASERVVNEFGLEATNRKLGDYLEEIISRSRESITFSKE